MRNKGKRNLMKVDVITRKIRKLINEVNKSIYVCLEEVLNISLPLLIPSRFITFTLTGRCNLCVFMDCQSIGLTYIHSGNSIAFMCQDI